MALGDLSSMTSKEKIVIKKKINELESNFWYLHDAYESVNIYTDIKKADGLNGKAVKKTPQNVDELERYQIYEQIRSM